MTRFWRFTLLTLLIALLPLRGWAWAVMPVSVPGSGGAAQVMAHKAHTTHAAAAATSDQSDALHCHAQDGSTKAAATPSDGGFGQGHTCSLCDLCHAGVIAPPSWAWFHGAPPVAPPSWAVSVAHGRDGVDGPFRPPRA